VQTKLAEFPGELGLIGKQWSRRWNFVLDNPFHRTGFSRVESQFLPKNFCLEDIEETIGFSRMESRF